MKEKERARLGGSKGEKGGDDKEKGRYRWSKRSRNVSGHKLRTELGNMVDDQERFLKYESTTHVPKITEDHGESRLPVAFRCSASSGRTTLEA
jgi:hypothetical protein